MSEKKKFAFLITYFKPSGKLYASEVVHWDIRSVDMNESQAYTPDALAKLRGLRDNGGPEALPGLCCDGWDGPILIEQASLRLGVDDSSSRRDDFFGDGVPYLLLPN